MCKENIWNKYTQKLHSHLFFFMNIYKSWGAYDTYYMCDTVQNNFSKSLHETKNQSESF